MVDEKSQASGSHVAWLKNEQIQVRDAEKVYNIIWSLKQEVSLGFLSRDIWIGCLSPAQRVLPLRGQHALLPIARRTWQNLGAGCAVWAEHVVFREVFILLYVTLGFYAEIFFKWKEKSIFSVITFFFFLFVAHLLTPTLNLLAEVKGRVDCDITLETTYLWDTKHHLLDT